MYFGVGPELMRIAVAVSSEQTYPGPSSAWVDFRVRECRVSSSTVVMIWPTCDPRWSTLAYAFATKPLPSATIEGHWSAIKYFSRISRGFELDTTHPVIASAFKGAGRSLADV